MAPISASNAPSNIEYFLSSDRLIIPFDSLIILSRPIWLALNVNLVPFTSVALALVRVPS